jgi:hypothetical protein
VPEEEAQIAAERANVLLDSGASGSYINTNFASMLGIKESPSEEHVLLPDGRVHKVLGTVKLRVRLQGFCEQIQLKMLDLQIPFDVILGDEFLRKYSAILDYATSRISLCKGRRTFVLKPAVGDIRDNEGPETPVGGVQTEAPAGVAHGVEQAPAGVQHGGEHGRAPAGGVNMLSALQAKRAVRSSLQCCLCLVTSCAEEEGQQPAPAPSPSPTPGTSIQPSQHYRWC